MPDKREKFVSLAEKRVTKAIKALRLVGNLANKHNYLYTDKDAQKIVEVLEGEIKFVKTRFFSEEGRRKPLFKL